MTPRLKTALLATVTLTATLSSGCCGYRPILSRLGCLGANCGPLLGAPIAGPAPVMAGPAYGPPPVLAPSYGPPVGAPGCVGCGAGLPAGGVPLAGGPIPGGLPGAYPVEGPYASAGAPPQFTSYPTMTAGPAPAPGAGNPAPSTLLHPPTAMPKQ